MEPVILGSLLLLGGVFALSDLFDRDDKDPDEPDPDPSPHGAAGSDTLSADHGMISGWGGDDDITVTDEATGWGNAGNDLLDADDSATAHGGSGDDTLSARDQATILGDDGDDVLDTQGVNGTEGMGAAAHGGAGEDTLSSLGLNDTLYGDAGNDSVISAFGPIYGGDGDDILTGTDSAVYGDAGNDTMGGFAADLFGGAGDDDLESFSSLEGGDGDDHLHATNYGGEADATGSADGGDGNDTIIAEDHQFGSGPLTGGNGDDEIHFFTGENADGGAGNDVMIMERSARSNTDGTISLGDGDDLLALDPNAEHEPYQWGDAQLTTVTDFDPAHDTLGIVVPEGSLDNLSLTLTEDPDGGFTDLTLATLNGDPPQVFRLEGVTGVDLADIQLYADHDAVLTGTSYGTGDDLVAPGDGPDTLIGEAGETLFGGADDDHLTVGEAGSGYGGDGQDTLAMSGDSGELHGDAGNDLLSHPGIAGGGSYGDAGNDTLTGSFRLYGGDGDNSVVGDSGVYGDAGNDVLHVSGYGEGSPGDVYGGAGDDTINGHFTFEGLSVTDAGDGNDVIVDGATNHQIAAGAGDDIAIISGFASSDLARDSISLGSGSDLLAAQDNRADGMENGGQLHVTDFNPTEDRLAIIITPEDLANSTLSVLPDPLTNSCTLNLTNSANSSLNLAIQLDGVQDFDLAGLTIFADQAAVLTGTPYQTGA